MPGQVVPLGQGRHEFFDRIPIRPVRQSAKRRTAPNVLTPTEIKAPADQVKKSAPK
jgi:hypothetical protein